MKIEGKIQRFAKFLKKLLVEVEDIDPTDLSDADVLNMFRNCANCGGELMTTQQQLHAIIEFDTPQRAFDSLCELVLTNDDCSVSSDEEFE